MSTPAATTHPASLAELFARHPEFANLRAPRPPKPQAAVVRRRERKIADSDELCAREFARGATATLRCQAESAEGLFGPLRGVGDCLGNVFPLGSLCYFDPATPADDRDWVLVWLSDQYYWRAARAAGRPLSRFAMKWLRHLGGEPYLLHVDGGVPLLDCKILGVLRLIQAPSEVRYASNG